MGTKQKGVKNWWNTEKKVNEMTTISKIRTKLQDAQEGIDSSKYTKEVWESEMKISKTMKQNKKK